MGIGLHERIDPIGRVAILRFDGLVDLDRLRELSHRIEANIVTEKRFVGLVELGPFMEGFVFHIFLEDLFKTERLDHKVLEHDRRTARRNGSDRLHLGELVVDAVVVEEKLQSLQLRI